MYFKVLVLLASLFLGSVVSATAPHGHPHGRGPHGRGPHGRGPNGHGGHGGHGVMKTGPHGHPHMHMHPCTAAAALAARDIAVPEHILRRCAEEASAAPLAPLAIGKRAVTRSKSKGPAGPAQPAGKGKGTAAQGNKPPPVRDGAPNSMYQIVQPNPYTALPSRDSKTGKSYYDRKVGDGLPGDRYKTHNADHSVVTSHDQDEKVNGVRPGKNQEKTTTGSASGKGSTEWHRFTPKTAEELKKAVADGTIQPNGNKPPKPWTDRQFQKNLQLQQKHFPDHKSGDTKSAYAEKDGELRLMTNHEKIKHTY